MRFETQLYFAILAAFVTGITLYSYDRYVINKDYVVSAERECDPATEEHCFVRRCDPEEEECTGDEATDTSFYTVVKRRADTTPLCDPTHEECAALSCEDGAVDCVVEYCDPSDKEAECTFREDWRIEESELDFSDGEPVTDEGTDISSENQEP